MRGWVWRLYLGAGALATGGRAASSAGRPSAATCSTRACTPPSRSAPASPWSSTTGPSSACRCSPTTWSGPGSGCSATGRGGPPGARPGRALGRGPGAARADDVAAAAGLDEVGLEAALRDQVGAFTRHSGVDCEVPVALARRLGGELETIVYRVAQEALLNVTRHAQAKRLWLELEGRGTGCTCASATTGSASTRWAAPSWSATATSAWWRCVSGSRWPVAASSWSRVPGPGWWCGPASTSPPPPRVAWQAPCPAGRRLLPGVLGVWWQHPVGEVALHPIQVLQAAGDDPVDLEVGGELGVYRHERRVDLVVAVVVDHPGGKLAVLGGDLGRGGAAGLAVVLVRH